MEIREALRLGKTIYELPLKVCYYARVSTDYELQATSIINQVDYFSKYVEGISNWTLVTGYVDEGISGKEVIHRENFLRMIEDGRKHRFDLVLTKSVSRFARNTIDSIKYTDLLLQYGIGVIFLNDNINTFYSDSEFRLTLMASIAQDELRKLSESVKFGLSQSINRGIVLGNSNILGYVKDNGKLVIVPEEAEIVKRIFSLFVTGKYKYSEVARKIKREFNKKYDSTGIKRILTNYKYKGYYCGGKTTVVDYKCNRRKKIDCSNWKVYRDYENIPPIVDEEKWEKVQKIIQNRCRNINYSNSIDCNKYKGKVFCKKHHQVLVVKHKRYKEKWYGYLVCPKCCSISVSLLERISRVHQFLEMWVFPAPEITLQVKLK